MSHFWDEETDAVNLPKNALGDEIQVRKVTKRGRSYIDVRTWYVDRRDGKRKPGKGITIAIDQLGEVLEAIDYVKGLDVKKAADSQSF